jgi:hypothetical protein
MAGKKTNEHEGDNKRQPKQQVSAPEQEVASETAAAFAPLTAGLTPVGEQVGVEAQVGGLNNPSIPMLQRQELAAGIGSMQGNQHLQRVIDSTRPGGGVSNRGKPPRRVDRHAVPDADSASGAENETAPLQEEPAPVEQSAATNTIQRVPIADAGFDETLVEFDPTTQDYQPNTYSMPAINYDMTRGANNVNTDVRIKFVNQPNPEDAPSEIPEGPTREFATTQCNELVSFWNNQFALEGERTVEAGNIFDRAVQEFYGEEDETEAVRLNLTFSATPVFDLGEDAHQTVALHSDITADGTVLAPGDPAAVAGRSRSGVIDAGNWFVNRDESAYPASNESIYAHEYGHLLGIPDEYSVSNPTMHALFHQVSPDSATEMGNDLDDAGVRAMILAALNAQMEPLVRNLAGEVSAAVGVHEAAMVEQVAGAIRDNWRDGALLATVNGDLAAELEGAGQEHALAKLSDALHFEAFDNLSNLSIARNAVGAELSPDGIESILLVAFLEAISSAEQNTVTVTYPNDQGVDTDIDVSIDVAPIVSSGTSPLAASAAAAATSSVGQPQPPGDRGVPPLYPSDTLIGRLTSLPGDWESVPDLMAGQINEMNTRILDGVTAILATSDIAAEVDDNVGQLYRYLYNMVTNVSESAALMTVREFLMEQISPLMETQVNELMTLVDAEIEAHHTAVGTGTDAAPDTPPDPALAAAVAQMEDTARTMLDPAAAVAAGAVAPTGHNVRFTVNALMGANSEGESVRTDQMQRIAENFNNNVPDLRHDDESEFSVRTV